MKIQILDKTKKKKVLENLNYLGKLKMNQLFIKTGDRVRIFSGNLSNDEIIKIWSMFQIEGIGLYFAKDFKDKRQNQETRVSIDGIHAIQNQINSNIVELEENQLNNWFKGHNIELSKEQQKIHEKTQGFVAVKYQQDFVGTAKIKQGKTLLTFLPKERRRRD